MYRVEMLGTGVIVILRTLALQGGTAITGISQPRVTWGFPLELSILLLYSYMYD